MNEQIEVEMVEGVEELPPEDPFVVPLNPRKAAYTQRQLWAFHLRKVGCDYETIKDKVGFSSAGAAEKAVKKFIDKHAKQEDLEYVRNLELERLDALQLIAWRRAKEGDLRAIDRIIKIMEQRAKYLGLNVEAERADQSVSNQTAIFIGGETQDYIQQLQHLRDQVDRKAVPQ